MFQWTTHTKKHQKTFLMYHSALNSSQITVSDAKAICFSLRWFGFGLFFVCSCFGFFLNLAGICDLC